jgi:Kdo2-lipid IVA lauroyltransferase/acyltransferase
VEVIAKWLFSAFGALPLGLNHWLGGALGLFVAALSPRHRQMTEANLARYWHHQTAATSAELGAPNGLSLKPLTRHAFIEQGKGLTELALAWTASIARLSRLFPPCPSWSLVETALQQKRPIIFVTPHLGCYDIAGRYVASRVPITALFRPPKLAWLTPIMEAGRGRGGATTAPADASGVRALLKTLKQGGSIMILPDQVPAAEKGGEGVWAPFFGKPAYTMTLLPRLAQSSGAAVFFFFAERLPRGEGYRMHFVPMTDAYAEDKLDAATQTNRMVERLINMAPSQYLWGYNRYKQPAGAPPLPTEPPTAPPPAPST